MEKVIFNIDGGAGRAICSIPALEKFIKKNPDKDVKVLISGWDNLVWGNQLLQDKTFNPDTKGIFDLFIRDCDRIVSPEPYRVPGYFRQELSLAEAFDFEINQTTDHSDLEKPRLFTTKIEEKSAANLWAECTMQQNKKKNVVIQPFGRGVNKNTGDIIDDASRSIESQDYIKIVKKLSTKYNLMLFAEPEFYMQEDIYTFKPPQQLDLRFWISIIDAADYIVSCDSVGQHIAYAMNKPGTVILGSTFAKNVTYPDHFQIIENLNVNKKYSPIRLCGLDCHLADRYNDKCMSFSEKEINDIVDKIIEDIEKKVK